MVALILGYVGVWVVVSVLAAVAQALLAGGLGGLGLPARLLTILSGVAIGAAGLYQFSEWKQVCLASCRHPLSAFEAAGTGTGAALRLGVSQGVACLGCCGAMMAMMAAVGSMNLAWMAVFAFLMTIEKLTATPAVTRLIGAGLLLAGAAVAASAVGAAPILAWISR
jgi:predicted metal-binding membrane protein